MNKICTSFEQSKKLIELGIDINTADMFYLNDGISAKLMWEHLPNVKKEAVAWSLSALLGLMPNFNMFKRTIECRIETINHLIDKACDPIDAAFEMVCWLKAEKYI